MPCDVSERQKKSFGIERYLTLTNEHTPMSCRFRSPDRIVNPRDPIDDEGLCGKQDHGDLDDDKLFRLKDDPESHDERRCACGRMTHSE